MSRRFNLGDRVRIYGDDNYYHGEFGVVVGLWPKDRQLWYIVQPDYYNPNMPLNSIYLEHELSMEPPPTQPEGHTGGGTSCNSDADCPEA